MNLNIDIRWPYLLCILFFIITLFYLFYSRIENFFVFFPDRNIDLLPDDLGLVCRDIYFETGDGERLNGWFFPVSGEKSSPVILFFHGNAGNMSHRLENIQLLLEQDIRVFIFDYRGYGKSSGRPTEEGLYLDGLAACDYLLENEGVSTGDIVLFGRSLGAAVAVNTALNRSVRSVIMESAFLSTKHMAKTMPLFMPLSYFLPPNYNNLEKVRAIKAPKLFIHGDDDEIVPFSMGETLYRESEPPKYFLCLEGAGHNDTYYKGGDDYFLTLAKFVHDSKI